MVSGEKKIAEELISELATRKLNLSIKLKNPVFVTVEPQPEESVDGQHTANTIMYVYCFCPYRCNSFEL